MERDFIRGYNEGYFMAQYLPDLAHKLSGAEGKSPRFEGFRKGVIRYEAETLMPDGLIKEQPKDVDASTFFDTRGVESMKEKRRDE